MTIQMLGIETRPWASFCMGAQRYGSVIMGNMSRAVMESWTIRLVEPSGPGSRTGLTPISVMNNGTRSLDTAQGGVEGRVRLILFDVYILSFVPLLGSFFMFSQSG